MVRYPLIRHLKQFVDFQKNVYFIPGNCSLFTTFAFFLFSTTFRNINLSAMQTCEKGSSLPHVNVR
jgi:hypothetical protein